MDPNHLENMIQCFDNLTEFIQGPCYENQNALINNNFLDIAANLLGSDEILDQVLEKMKKQAPESHDNPNQN